MPTLLALVLSGFRKQSILFVCTVAQIPNIVDGIFRRAVGYVVNMLLVWPSNSHQEMIRYKVVDKHLPFIWYNLLSKCCVFDTPILTPNTAHVAESYNRPAVAV